MPDEMLLMFCVVAPFVQIKVKGLAPPLIVVVTEPFALPQAVDVGEISVITGPVLLLTFTVAVALQSLASLTVTPYVPAGMPVIADVVSPVDQKISNGDEPPLIDTAADPFALPHDALTEETFSAGPPILFTVAEIVVVQPLASVAVKT